VAKQAADDFDRNKMKTYLRALKCVGENQASASWLQPLLWQYPCRYAYLAKKKAQGLNRLRKKVVQGAKPVPSAAKAEQICNHLRTA
jgi:hypothetical protein